MNDLSLHFDKPSFDLQFFLRITETIEEIADNMVMELGEDGLPYKKELLEFGDGVVRYLVGSDNWNAFISQFGKGSLMSSNNPFLGEYQGSSMWNPNRQSNAIFTRSRGSHVIPDWKSGYGYEEYTVNRKGNDKFNLERLGGQYSPKQGSENIIGIFKKYEKIMFDSIVNIFKKMDLSIYVQGGV